MIRGLFSALLVPAGAAISGTGDVQSGFYATPRLNCDRVTQSDLTQYSAWVKVEELR